MSRIHYFVWLSGQAADGITYLWFISLGLLVALLVAVVLNSPFRRGRYHPRNWLSLSPALITFAILVVGTTFEYNSEKSVSWPQFLNIALGILHLPALGILLWRLPGIRWFTAAVNFLIMWCSWWAWFVSAMSISGDWL